MTHFVGLDVSLQETSVCVVDETGKVLCERKVPTEPDEIAVLPTSVRGDYVRVGIEASPLSQWLINGLIEADLPMVCVETRHMKTLLKAQQINKSDRNDARGIAHPAPHVGRWHGFPLDQRRDYRPGSLKSAAAATKSKVLPRQKDILTGTRGGVSSQCPQILLLRQQGRYKD